jgi:hypothetical protein
MMMMMEGKDCPGHSANNQLADYFLTPAGAIHRWLPPAHAGFSNADFSTLEMEAICSSETSVHTRSTRRHIPEDGHKRKIGRLKIYRKLVSNEGVCFRISDF